MIKLEGLYTALITPFDAQGKLDQEGFRQNIRYQLQHHVQGIVVLGTTGEAPTLSSTEKTQVIEIALEEAKGKTTVMVGTGSYSTEQTILQTKQAQDMGADAALIVTPYYNKPTQEGLYYHFKAICEATTIPICVYNIQGRTGQNLQTDTLERLVYFPNIVAVKEASGNLLQMNEILSIFSQSYPDFKVLSGDDALTLPLMAMGGHGVISVVSNLLPQPMQSLVQAAQIGDIATARYWHYQLYSIFKAAFLETNPIPIKAAMNACGMAAGYCRLPLCDLTPYNMDKLKQILNSIPLSWLGQYGQTQSTCC